MFEDVNPFFIQGYVDTASFCDRKKETSDIASALNNGRNITLFSLRKMGKTGLIFHIGHLLSRNKQTKFLYSDIFNTDNTEQLAAKLGAVLFKELAPKRSILKWVGSVFKAFAPKVSIDPLTALPELTFDFQNRQDSIKTLENIFVYLRTLKYRIIWGIDEFQQIGYYKEKGTEALLRDLIQQTPNVNFIFSGSHKSMLLDMFSHAKRPFYQSTQWIELNEISEKEYTTFILKHFNKKRQRITKTEVSLILEFTMRHTWYTQYLCNNLYASNKIITEQKIRVMMSKILKEKESYFHNYRAMLSTLQWQVARAIALEEKVYEPNSQKFLAKHKLSAASAVKRAIESLIQQDLVSEIQEGDKRYFRLNDVFLIRWFQWVY